MLPCAAGPARYRSAARAAGAAAGRTAMSDRHDEQRRATNIRGSNPCLTNSIVRCDDDAARPDRRAAGRKGSPARQPPPLRRSTGCRRRRCPVRLADAGKLAEQPRQFRSLEVVGRPVRTSVPRQRTAMHAPRDLRHFIIGEAGRAVRSTWAVKRSARADRSVPERRGEDDAADGERRSRRKSD